ncbi:acetyl-CoA C-acetyltransferase [Loktanella fryxellensis]|uniref:Acetyl-CoA C-acetyltransferase n=1 Tax=Loktanella fryxellensis TaxID=245187 RepID=A0A1H8G7V2_9RHOB|nr:acetyl-CoA C-acyltransferase [Loktanella fryxellensis]SEN40102.1 acetyl-CoA C-acetyltransferase [Loktanella fryxellensis]
MTDIYVTGAARTPLGAFQGAFSTVSATALGSVAIRAAVDRAGIDPASVSEVLMGNVLPAGLGQAPARQASLGAGIGDHVPCTTVSKVCGSGMKAITQGMDAIRAGSAATIIAGGMESMTNAPYLLPKARGGARIGHDVMLDHMMWDGLEDAYATTDTGARRPMGSFGEQCAAQYGFDRAAQDAFATASVMRARAAAEAGHFDWEIAPVMGGRKHDQCVTRDEGPDRIDVARIPTLRAAFADSGTITAASASSINDGAAALVLMSGDAMRAAGVQPLARIVGHAAYAGEPGWFTTAPIHAQRRLAAQIGWSLADVDLFEINEAFAVVPMAAMADCDLPHDRVNVHGGACALGHPIGASGARIVVTLLGAMRARGARRGIASICIGGGEALALALEA